MRTREKRKRENFVCVHVRTCPSEYNMHILIHTVTRKNPQPITTTYQRIEGKQTSSPW